MKPDMKPLMTPAAVAAALALFAAGAPAAVSAEPVAIINARIETATPAGAIARGAIVFDNGRIVAVGADVTPPAGARIVDAEGRTVTPGLILPSTNLAAAEVSQVPSTRDDGAGDLLGAGFDVAPGINADSQQLAMARADGVTRAFVTPVLGRGGGGHAHDDSAFAEFSGGGHGGDNGPGLFSGQAAGLHTGAAPDGTVVFRPRAGMVIDMGESGAQAAGGSRGAAFVLLRQALADVRHFVANRAAYDRGEGRDLSISRLDLEALIPVVQGRSPLLVRVSSAGDIRAILAMAREERVRVALEGAEEGWRVATDIAEAGAAVIIDPQAALPASFETLGATLENAALLDQAGVIVAIRGSRDYNNLRQSRFNAGTAVAHGLPWQVALRAVTVNPARVWGVERELGTIETGKRADLVIWSGDPLETRSWPVSVFVDGKEQDLATRSGALARRYGPAPPNAPPPAWRF